MAKVTPITLPVFTEFNGKRWEIGTFELPVSITLDPEPIDGKVQAHVTIG